MDNFTISRSMFYCNYYATAIVNTIAVMAIIILYIMEILNKCLDFC